MFANVVSVHLVAYYKRFTKQVQYLIGNYLSVGNNSVNLILPLQITRKNDDQHSFTVNRLFVLDICLCWNK